MINPEIQRWKAHHPVAYQIETEVLRTGGIFRGELVKRLSYSSHLVSIHLTNLEEQGLVKKELKQTNVPGESDSYLTPTEALYGMQESLVALGKL
jgi:DNA-binding MarR family transcriptional regulator